MARILLVEDEVILAMTVQMDLEQLGHHVIGIANASDQAILWVYPSFPNCVIQAKYSVKAHSQGDSRENIQKCYFWNFDDIKNRSIMKQIIFFSYFLHPITESEEKISIWP